MAAADSCRPLTLSPESLYSSATGSRKWRTALPNLTQSVIRGVYGGRTQATQNFGTFRLYRILY
jgi:hypothetical protein